MNTFVKKLLVVCIPLFVLTGNAFATSGDQDVPCDGTRFNPCPVPEPSTPHLFLGALGVAVLVAKLRKKK